MPPFRPGPSRWVTLLDGRFADWNPPPASLYGRLDDTPLGAFLDWPPAAERQEPTPVYAGSRQPGWLDDGLQPVDSRAGAFSGCRVRRLVLNHDSHTRWFCPGVGLVHEERTTVMGRGDSQLDLLRYGVVPPVP
jgi:hypothetical protein